MSKRVPKPAPEPAPPPAVAEPVVAEPVVPEPTAPPGALLKPDSVSLALRRTLVDVKAANVLIERVRRREPGALTELVSSVRNKLGALTELVNRVRNKQDTDEELLAACDLTVEELSAVCDLAEGKFEFDSHFKTKENKARRYSEIANFVFEQKQAGAPDPIKQAMDKFKVVRRTVKYATAKYPIEAALKKPPSP
jgi:hypothetical protein